MDVDTSSLYSSVSVSMHFVGSLLSDDVYCKSPNILKNPMTATAMTYANVCHLLRMSICAARVALDHLRNAIANWKMEEQGTKQRALQGVIQLYRTVGIYFI